MDCAYDMAEFSSASDSHVDGAGRSSLAFLFEKLCSNNHLYTFS